jgi:photosystem II stability/assembly factor-like uncharacterized protein
VGTLCGGSESGAPESLSIAQSNPSVLYATRIGGAPVAVTCRSDDGGATWSEVGRLTGSFQDYLDVQASATDPLDVVRLVQDTWTTHVERSLDGGQSWTRTTISQSGSGASLRRAASDFAVLLLGRDSAGAGLWCSTDHGQTWTRPAMAGRTSVNVASLAIDPSDARMF